MKYIVLTTTMAFIVGLFAAGSALAAGESQWGSSSQSQETQQYGAMQEGQQQQQMAGQQLDQEQIRELQKKLNEEGFEAGPEDGIMGPKTRSALEEFQKEEGLAASGQPDQQTLDALDISVEQEEFFGVSPEFGEEKEQGVSEEQQQMQEQQQQVQEPYRQQQEQPGSGSMESR